MGRERSPGRERRRGRRWVCNLSRRMWWRRQGRRLERLIVKLFIKQIPSHVAMLFFTQRPFLVKTETSLTVVFLVFSSSSFLHPCSCSCSQSLTSSRESKVGLSWQPFDLSNLLVLQTLILTLFNTLYLKTQRHWSKVLIRNRRGFLQTMSLTAQGDHQFSSDQRPIIALPCHSVTHSSC